MQRSDPFADGAQNSKGTYHAPYPPVETSSLEQTIINRIKRAKLFIFLRHHRHELFDDAFQEELATLYASSLRGQPPIPPAQLALATLVQAYTGASDKDTCAQCSLNTQCTTSVKGRSVSIHPDEALLIELRQRQQTPQGRAKLRERVAVEYTLAYVGQWQGHRARYRGVRKNLFDLRRCAVVHNLHVLARSQSFSAEF